jgi:hypothetical protein
MFIVFHFLFEKSGFIYNKHCFVVTDNHTYGPCYIFIFLNFDQYQLPWPVLNSGWYQRRTTKLCAKQHNSACSSLDRASVSYAQGQMFDPPSWRFLFFIFTYIRNLLNCLELKEMTLLGEIASDSMKFTSWRCMICRNVRPLPVVILLFIFHLHHDS